MLFYASGPLRYHRKVLKKLGKEKVVSSSGLRSNSRGSKENKDFPYNNWIPGTLRAARRDDDKENVMNKKAFTLIELLVVVLIIGILAAVALPQYQLAVTKARFTELKVLAKSLATAEEVYHLANGVYTTSLEDLDVQIPQKENIYCGADDIQISCGNAQLGMTYQARYFSTGFPDVCIVSNTDVTSIAAQVCKNETGNEPIISDYYMGYHYQ